MRNGGREKERSRKKRQREKQMCNRHRKSCDIERWQLKNGDAIDAIFI